MSTYKDFTDDVNGTIIGGDYGMCWVTYQDRKQGKTNYPANKVEAEQMCSCVVEEIKKDCGEAFNMIYPDKDAWKFHFDGI